MIESPFIRGGFCHLLASFGAAIIPANEAECRFRI